MADAAAVVIPVVFSPGVRPLSDDDVRELLDPRHWREVLDQYARSMNVAVCMTDRQGGWIGPAYNLKPLWRIVRSLRPAGEPEQGLSLEPGACAAAITAAWETGTCAGGRDNSGQAYVVAPLLLQGHVVGTIMAGQVFDRFPEQLALERMAREFSVPVSRLWEAARSQPLVSTATLQVFGDLLKNLGEAYLQARYSVIQERERAAEIVALSRDLAERRRMEQRLRDSETNLRLALRASGAVTWRWEPGTAVAKWSPEFRELYGFDPEEPASFELWKERVHPADLAAALDGLHRTVRSTSALEWREGFRIIHPEAGTRWIAALGRVTRDAAGRAISVTGISFDVTERKIFEEALKRRGERLELLSETLAQLLDAHTPDAIAPALFRRVAAHLGPDTFFNFSVQDETGLHSQVSAGSHPEEASTRLRLELDRTISASVAGTRQPLYATDVQHADFVHPESVLKLGIQCYFCSPLIVGDRFLGTVSFTSSKRATFEEDDLRFVQIVVQYMAVALDRWQNTDQLTHAHELLADRAKHLDLLVQQRTAKMQETIAELEAFSYSVAHDLRAPLRAMEGYAEVVLETNELSETNTVYLTRIRKAASRLDRLTREILSYSQLSRSTVDNRPLDLERIVGEVIEQYPDLRNQRQHIQVESPLPWVMGQESLLAQIFANLLGNACKFVAPGQQPRVRVRSQTQGARVRLFVEDSGIGIAPEHEPRLFRIFGRIHPDREYEGTGMGLSIVKRAAEKMGGTSGMTSVPNVGSSFWVDLPRAEPHASAEA